MHELPRNFSVPHEDMRWPRKTASDFGDSEQCNVVDSDDGHLSVDEEDAIQVDKIGLGN